MCVTCGCSEPRAHPDPPHSHSHSHADPDPGPDPQPDRLLRLEQAVLRKNAAIAAANRADLHARRILAVNFMSSPGSGKTTLLERTIFDMRGCVSIAVVQGDQATDRDAARIRGAGAKAVQINTGKGCHLDAAMVARGLSELAPESNSIVAIENVGNLVCPALFDLGEHARIAVLSVTEGADKPLKYPYLFRGADAVVVNKADLLAHVEFDLDDCRRWLREVNTDAPCFVVSARTGDGMGAFYEYLFDRARALAGFTPGAKV